MKETNELVIHAALVDGKHLEIKVNVEAENEDLAKVLLPSYSQWHKE